MLACLRVTGPNKDQVGSDGAVRRVGVAKRSCKLAEDKLHATCRALACKTAIRGHRIAANLPWPIASMYCTVPRRAECMCYP